MTRILGSAEAFPADSPQGSNPYFDAAASFTEATTPADAFEMPGQRMDSGWFAIPMQAEMAGQSSGTSDEEEPAWPAKEPDATTELLGRVIEGIRRIGTTEAVEAPEVTHSPVEPTPIFDQVAPGLEIEAGANAEVSGVPPTESTPDTEADEVIPAVHPAAPLWPIAADAPRRKNPDDEPTDVFAPAEPATDRFFAPDPTNLFKGRPPLPQRTSTHRRDDTMHQQLRAKHDARTSLGIISNAQEARIPGAALQQLRIFDERPSRALARIDNVELGQPDLETMILINMARLAQPALHNVSIETIRAVAPVPTSLETVEHIQPAQPDPSRSQKLLSAARTLWRDLHPRKYARTYDFSRLLTR